MTFQAIPGWCLSTLGQQSPGRGHHQPIGSAASRCAPPSGAGELSAPRAATLGGDVEELCQASEPRRGCWQLQVVGYQLLVIKPLFFFVIVVMLDVLMGSWNDMTMVRRNLEVAHARDAYRSSQEPLFFLVLP